MEFKDLRIGMVLYVPRQRYKRLWLIEKITPKYFEFIFMQHFIENDVVLLGKNPISTWKDSGQIWEESKFLDDVKLSKYSKDFFKTIFKSGTEIGVKRSYW